MKVSELVEGAYKEKQESIAAARRGLQDFTKDLMDGTLEMLLVDPTDKTGNAELKNALTLLKKQNPDLFTILKDGFAKV